MLDSTRRTAIVNAIKAVANLEVIWFNPNAPRPPLPYVMLNLTVLPQAVDRCGEITYNDDGDACRVFRKTATMSVNVYDTNGYNYINTANTIINATQKMKMKSILDPAYVTVLHCKSLVDLSTSLDGTGIEKRAVFDMIISFADMERLNDILDEGTPDDLINIVNIDGELDETIDVEINVVEGD
jgi:hypothetical protein